MPGKSPTRRWTREEHLAAFHLYSQLDFGQLHHRQPDIIALADRLSRTPSSVAMKLCNFASLDTRLQARGIRGLSAASAGVAEVWEQHRLNPRATAESARKAFHSLKSDQAQD
jgi:hypothetical protein